MFKKKLDKPFPDKLARRVKKIPTADLSMWVETSLSEVGRCMSQFEKTRETVYLEEALKGAEAVNAVISELYNRHMV